MPLKLRKINADLKKKCQKANELFLTKFLRIDEEGKLLRNRNDRNKKMETSRLV